jgi:hypothetical protein
METVLQQPCSIFPGEVIDQERFDFSGSGISSIVPRSFQYTRCARVVPTISG